MRAVFAIVSAMMRELIRKKDVYVLFIFLIVLLTILACQNFFQIEGISRYVRDFGYTAVMFFSFIIAVTFTARQIPAEIEARTIYPLLAKPLSRYTLIFSKFCGGAVVSVLCFILFFTVYGLFCFFGVEGVDPVLFVQGLIFGILCLCLVSALVVFLSTFMTLSANVTVSFLLFMLINGFSGPLRNTVLLTRGIASSAAGVVYYLLPHFDFYDLRIRITHAWDPLPMWLIFSVTAYTVFYCFMLLFFAGAIFRRKRL
ncbi:MAG: ABC transporter permease subunit [Candidatus Tantalella remota]|nr:ABC transporter permease subunit [Candidatus Tantalella remota]